MSAAKARVEYLRSKNKTFSNSTSHLQFKSESVDCVA